MQTVGHKSRVRDTVETIENIAESLRSLAESFGILASGLTQVVSSQDVQTKMLGRVLEVLTKKPDGPNEIAEALRALVAVVRDVQASNQQIELRLEELVAAVFERLSALEARR